MKCNLIKLLTFVICLTAGNIILQAKSYTKLHNKGNTVHWESNFPEEVIGVKLTVKFQPQSDSQESVVSSQYFAANEIIAYPFAIDAQKQVFENGFYKWELSLIIAGANVLEKQGFNRGVEGERDENGRYLNHLKGSEAILHAHRNIDASAKVTSGHFRVVSGSILDSVVVENESKNESNK